MSAPDLSSLGWDDRFSAALAAHSDEQLAPGRVTRVDRGACDVLAATGPARVTLSGALLAAAATDPLAGPCAGDWLALRTWPDGRLTAEALIERRSAIVRTAATPGTSRGQVLAANVDVALLVEPLLPEPDLGRVERLLTLAWDSDARPVVVLTKADLAPDAALVRDDIAAAAPGAEVLVVSAVTGAGLAELAAVAAPGTTLVLLGASGAGKSTLTNALAAAEVMATRTLRADHKGRHTTAHRELVVLPSGALLIDTPGLRSVGLPAAATAGLEWAFAEIEALAAGCRFADCAHAEEPGCAVQAAVATGELPERRLASWRKLGREARWMAMRHDARLRSEERARWKRIHAEVRRSGRIRP